MPGQLSRPPLTLSRARQQAAALEALSSGPAARARSDCNGGAGGALRGTCPATAGAAAATSQGLQLAALSLGGGGPHPLDDGEISSLLQPAAALRVLDLEGAPVGGLALICLKSCVRLRALDLSRCPALARAAPAAGGAALGASASAGGAFALLQAALGQMACLQGEWRGRPCWARAGLLI